MARPWKFLAQIHKPLAQFHGREGVYSSGIEFGNDARVCGFGHPEAIPHGNVEPRQTGLVDRRKVGQRSKTGPGSHGIGFDRTGAKVRQGI